LTTRCTLCVQRDGAQNHVETLKGFKEEDQERILRWSRETLGMVRTLSADKRAKRGVFFIDNQPYTGWIDYDRDDLKKHEDHWIPWLEERLQMILIRPLDRVLHRGSPDHG
jgi:hypothetical protein